MKTKPSSRVNWRPVDDKPKVKDERVAVKRRDPEPEPAPEAKPKRVVRKVKKPVLETSAVVKPKAKPTAKSAPVAAKPTPKKPKEHIFVISESDTKKTRVVLLLSPAEGERQEMIGIRQQFRKEGQKEWQFAKTGVSMISDVEILRALRDGCDELIEVMEGR